MLYRVPAASVTRCTDPPLCVCVCVCVCLRACVFTCGASNVDRMSLPRSASSAALLSALSPSISSRCSIRFARATSRSRQRPHPSPALSPRSTRRSTLWLRHRSCPLTYRRTWTSSRYVPFLARPLHRALPIGIVSGLRFDCRFGP